MMGKRALGQRSGKEGNSEHAKKAVEMRGSADAGVHSPEKIGGGKKQPATERTHVPSRYFYFAKHEKMKWAHLYGRKHEPSGKRSGFWVQCLRKKV